MSVPIKLFLRYKFDTQIRERTIQGPLSNDAMIMLSKHLHSVTDHFYFQGTFEPNGRTPRRLREPKVEC